MKKLMIVGLCAVLGTFAQGQIMMNKMSEKALKATGGRLMEPGTQRGEIVVVDCQSAAKAEWVAAGAQKFGDVTHFKVRSKTGSFDIRKPALEGNATLFVVDDAALPMSLAAVEAHWALVNVAPLKSDKPAFFEMRVKKEMARTFALLCGGANSSYPTAIVGPVASVSDLDGYMHDNLPIDVILHFTTFMEKFGAAPGKITTYRNACAKGWAPAPTNDYQKAIWEKANASPENPMKIEFDPKKGR